MVALVGAGVFVGTKRCRMGGLSSGSGLGLWCRWLRLGVSLKLCSWYVGSVAGVAFGSLGFWAFVFEEGCAGGCSVSASLFIPRRLSLDLSLR